MSVCFLRDKRGVGEIIASLMIVFVISTAGVILYTYSLNSFASTGGSFRLRTINKEEQARERLLITAVWWEVTANRMNVTVLNYGKIEIVIDAVYIDGNRATEYSSGRGTTVGTGELISVKFTSPVPIQEGQTYEIAVVTERGNRNVAYWKALS